jgi:cytoskeletal protein RodZ
VRLRLGPLRLVLAGALGVAAALLVACGSGGANLIPVANAGPLQNDFNAIANDVANGSCTATMNDLQRAQSDAASLPSTVDPRLRSRINQGLADLARTAPTECAKNSTSTQTTTAPTTSTQTTSTQTTTAPPTTTTTAPTTTAPPTTTTAPPTTTTSPVPDNGGGTPGPSTNAGAGAPGGAGGAGAGGN